MNNRTTLDSRSLILALLLGGGALAVQGQLSFNVDKIGGGPDGSVIVNPEPGSVNVIGGGNDIWDTTDEFEFYSADVTGDFDLRVRAESCETAGQWTKAGIMARETLDPGSRDAFSKITPNGTVSAGSTCGNGQGDVSFMYRTWLKDSAGPTGGQHEDRIVGGDHNYPVWSWIRLERVGNLMRAYASKDGVSWTGPVTQDTATWAGADGVTLQPLAATLKVGLGVSRHPCAGAQTAQCDFRDFGSPTDPLVVSRQPADVTLTLVDASSGTVSFDFGVPGGYDFLNIQWFKGNGTPIAGATGPTLSMTVGVADSGGMFFARATNKLAGDWVETAMATLTVVPDTSPPTLLFAHGVSVPNNQVALRFSKKIDPASLSSGVWAIDNGLTVNNAFMGGRPDTVILEVSPMTEGITYNITVSGVADLAGNPADNQTGTFTMVPAAPRAVFASTFDTTPPISVARLNGISGVVGGVLQISTPTGSGSFVAYDFLGGQPVNNFHATWRMAVGGGTCCGERMADGFAFVLGGGMTAETVWGEDGVGNGLIVSFDTWDNNTPDTAPAIDARFGGSVIAFQAMDPAPGGSNIREGGRAPDGPILLNANGSPVSLFTFGPAPAVPQAKDYINVEMDLTDNDGSYELTLLYSNVVVFHQLDIPYVPQLAGNWGISSRVGGANEDVWIDDLYIVANYTRGPAFFSLDPVDQAVFVTETATFTAAIDGTPTYQVQWYLNDVAIPGATGLTYTTPVTTTANNGDVYYATVSNALTPTPVKSATATLTVNNATLVKAVTATGPTDKVIVYFSKPVKLQGAYSEAGMGTLSAVYGATHSIVVLTTTTALIPDTLYTLTITGEVGEDNTPLVPDPAIVEFNFGYGSICPDLSGAAAPAGTRLAGVATMPGDGTVHLNEELGGQAGGFIIENRTAGLPLDRIVSTFKLLIYNTAGSSPADGCSFNWASDLPDTAGYGEEGAGSGLSVCWDTYDNGGGDDTPAMDVKWRGTLVPGGHKRMDVFSVDPTDWKDVKINLDPSGKLDVYFGGNLIFDQLQIPNYAPIANSRFGFYSRTGGADESHWLKELCLNNYVLGPVAITVDPAETTGLELQTVKFTVEAQGSPSFSYQWLTNGTPVPGATKSFWITPSLTEGMDGMQVSVIVNNDFSSATSQPATLHVTLNPRVLTVIARKTDEVHVVYSHAVDLFSGSYEFDWNTTEASRKYGAAHNEVIIITDSSLLQGALYNLIITGVNAEAPHADLMLVPDPTTVQFQHGYGKYCADLSVAGTAPAGMTIQGTAAIPGDGSIHLTEDVGSSAGDFLITDQNNTLSMDRFQVRFKLLIGGNQAADGCSFNVAPGMPLAVFSEAGAAPGGLTVGFDTYENGGDEAPAINIKWNNAPLLNGRAGNLRGILPGLRGQGGPAATTDYQDVYINMDPDGKLDVYLGNNVIFSKFQTPFTGFTGANWGMGARTGGATETCYIKDFCINNFSLGGVTFTKDLPATATIDEAGKGSFAVDLNGLPPYTVQWYSNNVAIAGATTFFYTTPALGPQANGAKYYAVAANYDGSVTSTVTTVSIKLTSVTLSVQANTDGSVTLSWPGGGTLQATPALLNAPAVTPWLDTPYSSPLVIPKGYFGTGNTNVFFRVKQ